MPIFFRTYLRLTASAANLLMQSPGRKGEMIAISRGDSHLARTFEKTLPFIEQIFRFIRRRSIRTAIGLTAANFLDAG